jgi:hypothetical protein
MVAVDTIICRSAPAFGDVKVFDNKLREGPDPASRLIGRAQGFGVNASLDGSSIFTAIDFVFSGDYREYSGSTLTTQGQFDPTGAPSERSIVHRGRQRQAPVRARVHDQPGPELHEHLHRRRLRHVLHPGPLIVNRSVLAFNPNRNVPNVMFVDLFE